MENKKQKIYYYLSVISIVAVIIANFMAGRLIMIGSIQLPASILVFPITFIVGDVLSELYGFKPTLRVICLGFIANFVAVLMCYIATLFRAPAGWGLSEAYSAVFSFTPRVLAASLVAFLVGGTLNSLIMVVMKKQTKGKFLWLRTITSTIAGEFVDSFIFCTIAFVGILDFKTIMYMVLIQASLKVAYEVVFTPIVYLCKNKLKGSSEEIEKK